MSVAILDHIEAEEGYREFVYDDANGRRIKPGSVVVGHPTCGIGLALDVEGLDHEEARWLLARRVEKRKAALDKALPWWRGLSEARQIVLISMAYQMGMAGLLKFKNTLAAMQRGDYAGAADGMLASLWARQTPERAKRLAKMMRDG